MIINDCNRCVVLSIYSPQAKLYKSVLQLLRDLKEMAFRFVVVVNGDMNDADCQILEKISDVYIKRENRGFDAGAYKVALQCEQVKQILNQSDELVLCNDTFWGPFVSFFEIFEQMKNHTCDFWGINQIDINLYRHIQSYFLVFRKKILCDNVLNSFFVTIDENSTDFNDAVCNYEQGIYDYLTRFGYIADALHHNSNINLSNMAPALWIEHIPILRKKLFFQKNEDPNMLMCLRYVAEKTKYSCDLVLEEIYERCGRNIRREDYEKTGITPSFIEDNHVIILREELLHFLDEHGSVFIYGCGRYGHLISNILPNSNIVGYIQSSHDKESFLGKPVFALNTLSQCESINVILALGYDNTQNVLQNIPLSWNVLKLWK